MEREMSEKESLLIIQQMLQRAKQNISDGSIFYLIWGWAVLASTLGQYLLTRMDVKESGMVWPVFMLSAAIISIVIGRKKGKKQRFVTFVGHSINYVWMGFGAYLILIFFMVPLAGWQAGYLLIIGLYGLGTFVSGGILKFRPLIVGGLLSIVLAIAGVIFSNHINTLDSMLLMLSASVIISYLIPGYMLRAKKDSNVA